MTNDTLPGGATHEEDIDFDFATIDAHLAEMEAASLAAADGDKHNVERDLDEIAAEVDATDPEMAYAYEVAEKAVALSMLQQAKDAIAVGEYLDESLAMVDADDETWNAYIEGLKTLEQSQAEFFEDLAAIREAHANPETREAVETWLRGMCREHGIRIPDAD